MRINHQHNLTRKEAYERISNLLPNLQRQYADKISDPRISWNSEHTRMNYNINIIGFSTSDQVYLEDKQVILEGKIPFMARMFSRKIEERVREQLQVLFS